MQISRLLFLSILSLLIAGSCKPVASPAAPTVPASSHPRIPTVRTPTSATTSPAQPTIPPEILNASQLLPSGLRIEEHPLVQRPDLEPLLFTALDGQNEVQLLRTHATLLRQSLRPESYYAVCHCTLWAMHGTAKLETRYAGTPTPAGMVPLQVTRAGSAIFSTSIIPPGVTADVRALAVYQDHWVLELARQKEVSGMEQVDSFFAGEIFIDGRSLNDLYRYSETYGFQTIAGKPFYFYKRLGKIGIVYDGQETLLGYDGVPHYGCCSAGALNPLMARNMLAFFAWRGAQWYYVEIGAFDEDR